MPVAVTAGKHDAGISSLPLDEQGFLVDLRHWNRAIAQLLASRHGLGTLGTVHWLLIDFVRDRYFRRGALPPTHNLCRRLGVSRESVDKSFGDCRVLWQIAGLPNPGDSD